MPAFNATVVPDALPWNEDGIGLLPITYKLTTSHRLVVFILKNVFRGISFLPMP